MKDIKNNRKYAFSSAEVFSTHSKNSRKYAFTLAEVFSTHSKNNRKYAFTLAEVLITLGIIGVVAALTLPNIVAHYKEQQLVSRLKKAYSVMNQALKMSELENGEYEHWDNNSDLQTYLNKYWIPYINVVTVCTTYKECGFDKSRPYKYLDGTDATLYVSNANYRYPILTSDGILYSPSIRYGDEKSEFIIVDLNGSRRPNTHGKDLFFFVRVANKGIQPYGYDKSIEEIESNCSPTNHGTYCAAKIIKDGWKVKYNFN